MPTTASGLRYPTDNDPFDVGLDISNLASDVDARMVARYATAAARDVAIPSPANGDVAWVSGVGLTGYSSGAWRTLASVAPLTQSGKTSATVTASNQRTGSVAFPTTFPSVPVVQISVEVASGSSVDLMAVMTSPPSKTGFTWRVRERSASTVTVGATLHWTATVA